MYIIVGLGNPGQQYAHTRHNVGFDTVDIISKKQNILLNKTRHKALLGEGTCAGERVVLVKPQTFMNLSGESITELVRWYKITISQLVIIYDDIDLEVGKLRIRPQGSAGSHNGMRSIIDKLGKDDFPRVRIGIGMPPMGWDLADYVLSRFLVNEKEIAFQSMMKAADAVEAIIQKGVPDAMNRFNG